MLIQILVAFLAVAATAYGMFLTKIKAFFSKNKDTVNDSTSGK